jgi:membrane-bound serine protease (ClpP class)
MAQEILLIGLLLAGGLLLVLVEICTPSLGLLGLAATACFVAAIWLTFGLSPWAGVALIAVLVVGVPFYVIWAMRLLPKTAIGRKLFVSREPAVPGEGVPDSESNRTLLGAEGEALSTLRPSGVARIDGRRMSVWAESGYIAAGARVRVVKAGGMNLTVRALDPAKAEPPPSQTDPAKENAPPEAPS